MSCDPPIHAFPSGPAVVELPHGAANTERAGRAANAAHALCELLWEALHEQLVVRSEPVAAFNGGSAPIERAAELAERLADIAATVALLVGADGRATVSPAPPLAPRPRPWHPPPGEQSRASQTPPGNEILEEPGGERPAAWIDLIGNALAQFERDRLPFTVLLVELLDAEHLWLGGRAGELGGLTHQMESALIETLGAMAGRPAASLTSERPDRYWLLLPQTDRLGARALAERLVHAFVPVGGATGRADPAEQYFATLSAQRSSPRARHNGAPLQLAVGTAVCPDNGQEAAALAAHADAELSAARGAGQPIISVSGCSRR